MSFRRILAVSALLWGVLWAKSDLPEGLDAKLIEGIRLVHMDRYDEAFAMYAEVQKVVPNHPASYFFVGASLQWIAFDYMNYDLDGAFFSNMNKTVALSQAMVNKKPDDPWALFYLGGGYGFMGLTSIRYGNWLKAFFDGMTGYKYMMKALDLKPDLYDVYYGLGQFHYWRSKKAAVIRAFTSQDEMKQGIDELMLAAKKGYFTVHETKNALISIYIEENDIPKTMALLADTMAVFPDYLFSFWALAQSHIKLGNHREALKALDHVERKLTGSKWSGGVAYVRCYALKAQCWGHLKEVEKAKEYIAKARAIDSRKYRGILAYAEYMRVVETVAKSL